MRKILKIMPSGLSAWKSFLLVMGLHAFFILAYILYFWWCVKFDYTDLINNSFSGTVLFTLIDLPFFQFFYVIPMLIVFKRRRESQAIKGVLIAFLLTFLPIVLYGLMVVVVCWPYLFKR